MPGLGLQTSKLYSHGHSPSVYATCHYDGCW